MPESTKDCTPHLDFKYIQPFDSQKVEFTHNLQEAHQKGIVTEQKDFCKVLTNSKDAEKRISASIISDAFNYARRLRTMPDAPITTRKKKDGPNNCLTVYHAFEAAVKSGKIIMEEIKEAGEIVKTYVKVEPSLLLPPAQQEVFDSFPEEAFKKALRDKENTHLQILDTWISKFFDDDSSYKSGAEIINWLDNTTDKTFDILVLNPFGHALELRAKADLGDKIISTLRKDSIEILEKLLKYQKKYPARLQIRLFDEMPAVNAFIFNKVIFHGYYLSFAAAPQTAFYGIPNVETHPMSKDIKEHFKTIWERQPPQILNDDLLKQLKNERQQMDKLHEGLKDTELDVFLPDNFLQKETTKTRHQNNYGTHIKVALRVESHKHKLLTANWLVEEDYTVEGHIQPIHDHYFRCQFYYKQKALTLNLVIPIDIKSNKMNWVIYSAISGEDAFCGIGVIHKKAADASHVGPSQEQIEDAIAAQNYAFWEPANLKVLKDTPLRDFSGTFLAHSYGRDNNDKENIIVSNILKIHPSGFVEYIKKHTNNKPITGLVYTDALNQNLFIEFKNQETKSLFYFIFHLQNIKIERNRIYAGTYIGLSQNHNNPLSLRVVLEYISDEEQDRLKVGRNLLYSKGYEALPQGIKEALTGRIENFISFPRLKGKITTFGQLQQEVVKNKINNIAEVYVKAACYEAVFGTIEEVMRQLTRAYKNGYTDFEDFEAKLLKIDERVYRDKHGKKAEIQEAEKKISNKVIDSQAYKDFIEAHNRRRNM